MPLRFIQWMVFSIKTFFLLRFLGIKICFRSYAAVRRMICLAYVQLAYTKAPPINSSIHTHIHTHFCTTWRTHALPYLEVPAAGYKMIMAGEELCLHRCSLIWVCSWLAVSRPALPCPVMLLMTWKERTEAWKERIQTYWIGCGHKEVGQKMCTGKTVCPASSLCLYYHIPS